MNELNSSIFLGALDECIEHYIEERRNHVGGFIQRHFSIHETLQIQKKSFPVDLIFIPINALWSIPYLSIKKLVETLDKIGVAQFNSVLERLPSGIKTGYQKEVELLIANELLDCDSLIKTIEAHPILQKVFTSGQLATMTAQTRRELNEEIEKYSSSQSLISDLSSSLMTLSLGWFLFGDRTLGVLDIGNKIARKMAHDKAASGFFLGKNLGSAFYNTFPPEPTRMQIFVATIGVGFFLTGLSLFTSVMSDPLRKQLGLHRKKLNILIDNLEEILFLHFRKEIKKAQKNSAFAEAG